MKKPPQNEGKIPSEIVTSVSLNLQIEPEKQVIANIPTARKYTYETRNGQAISC
jgi:hypothetical protein